MTADECTRRWKSLRDKFVRENKKVKKKKRQGRRDHVMFLVGLYIIVMLFIGDIHVPLNTESKFLSLCCNFFSENVIYI